MNKRILFFTAENNLVNRDFCGKTVRLFCKWYAGNSVECNQTWGVQCTTMLVQLTGITYLFYKLPGFHLLHHYLHLPFMLILSNKLFKLLYSHSYTKHPDKHWVTNQSGFNCNSVNQISVEKKCFPCQSLVPFITG